MTDRLGRPCIRPRLKFKLRRRFRVRNNLRFAVRFNDKPKLKLRFRLRLGLVALGLQKAKLNRWNSRNFECNDSKFKLDLFGMDKRFF